LAAGLELQTLARAAGGSVSLFVDPSPAGQASSDTAPGVGAARSSSLQPDNPNLNAISQRLKASFDPQGIFNPGLTTDANQSRA
jgi:glycolate oxidase FAD binding subunit